MRLPTRPSTRSPLQQQPKTGKSFRAQGAGQVRPRTTPAKRELEAETRLSMVRKIIQWVPIDGTRWRNEVANGHDNHEVGFHYGVAPGGDMAPLRELLNTAAFRGLCRCHHGDSGFSLYQTQNRDSLRRQQVSHSWR